MVKVKQFQLPINNKIAYHFRDFSLSNAFKNFEKGFKALQTYNVKR